MLIWSTVSGELYLLVLFSLVSIPDVPALISLVGIIGCEVTERVGCHRLLCSFYHGVASGLVGIFMGSIFFRQHLLVILSRKPEGIKRWLRCKTVCFLQGLQLVQEKFSSNRPTKTQKLVLKVHSLPPQIGFCIWNYGCLLVCSDRAQQNQWNLDVHIRCFSLIFVSITTITTIWNQILTVIPDT